MRRFSIPTLALLTVFLTAPASASTWEMDTAHSSVQFAVSHLMVSTVRGTFNKFSAIVDFNEDDPTKSTVDATIDATSIDTREAKRDEHLKGPDFFDVVKYPVITFKSKSIAKTGEDKYRVIGDLTLHGVTKEVSLEATGSPKPLKDPFGKTRIGGALRGKVNRKDFGMTWNKGLDSGGVVVGDEVTITIDVELTKQ